MKSTCRKFAARLTTIALCAAALFLPLPAGAYSVLSHEEIVDMAWKDRIIPMLRARFPGINLDEVRRAHSYAYGGSVIQDIGYYPFGSRYFSDLLHYVRPNEFVDALIRDSTTPDEYAFALGALAHFCGDIIGHPAINQVTSDENPPLRNRFGDVVTYAQSPTAHIRTEFGFDVVEVAQGHYSQENYRDFVGFQVSKSLLERAFQETYGIPMGDVMKHEDLAIGTYRRSVSSIIPAMTKIAFVSYKNQIQQATPGIQKRKFLYRLNQTEYEKDFGADYYHVGVRGQVAAFFLHFVPKVGPFKALKVTLPDAKQQNVYIKSMNKTVDRFRVYLAEIHAAPAPLPPPDAKDAQAARKAAGKVAKDVTEAKRSAVKEKDPEQKAAREKVAANVQRISEIADAAAARTEAKVEAAQEQSGSPVSENSIPADRPIQPPTTPVLPELDLDTGGTSGAGEYQLADQTYARLLRDLVKSAGHASNSSTNAPAGAAPIPHLDVNPAVVADVERFFAHPAAHTGPPLSAHEVEEEAALSRQVQADLASLKTLDPPQAR